MYKSGPSGGVVDKQRVVMTHFNDLIVVEFSQEIQNLAVSAGIASADP